LQLKTIIFGICHIHFAEALLQALILIIPLFNLNFNISTIFRLKFFYRRIEETISEKRLLMPIKPKSSILARNRGDKPQFRRFCGDHPTKVIERVFQAKKLSI
jgi:hypothetical protein